MNEQLFDQIEQYLAGELTAKEKSLFEEGLKTDQDLQDAYKAYRIAQLAGEAKGREILKARLNSLGTDLLANSPPYRPPFFQTPVGKTSLAMAATFLVILLGWWIYPGLMQPSMPELYEDYMVNARPDIPGSRSAADAQHDLWNYAIDAMVAENYPDVRRYLIQYLQDSTDDSEARFYLAFNYLNMDSTQAAIQNFRKVHPNYIRYPEAQWLEALAYLKMEDKKAVLKKLDEIIDGPELFRKEEAKALKAELP